MSSQQAPVCIVGAGMAGLACALKLGEAGVPIRLIEASDGVGGRVRTDQVDGFMLDRGFQVYLDTYPETGKLLDLEALDLKPFAPGALVYRNDRLHRLMDVFRRPSGLWASLRTPVGGTADKLRVARMRMRILASSFEKIARSPEQTTEAYLRQYGFSESMIDQFFRPFYGGIFLERELQTSSRLFEFTFKLFARGSATVPANGMGAIPAQLAARLPAGCLLLNSPVIQVNERGLTLTDGRALSASAVIVATDASVAQSLLPNPYTLEPRWRSVCNLYFAAKASPLKEAIICLNASGRGLINNVCVMSDAAPSYAPSGQALISVSVLGLADSSKLTQQVIDELAQWFGPVARQWRPLRTDRIQRALPEQRPGRPSPKVIESGGLWFCGDYLSTASIEGAVTSGQETAQALLNHPKIGRLKSRGS